MIDRNAVGVCAGSLLVVWCLCLPVRASAEPIPLKRAVDLALTHATTTAIAAADEQRAFQSYRELHNNYIPQLSVGSGLGKSWGYPLSLEGSAPALFNSTAQSAVFNPALREFLKAARAEWQASTSQTKDQRNAVIQDTVLSYAELNKWEQRIGRLREEQAAAKKIEEAVAERVKEGVESPLETTKARLSTARTRLRVAEAEGSADVLREHLAKLTGQPASTIETIADSIPPFPALQQDEELQTNAENSSPVVQSAMEHARAQYLRAKGEHKMFWPTLDFAAQYALLATFNNYDRFFQPNSFQANNATIGVAIRFPFFSPTQSAHAKAADAEALKARKQAEASKNQVSEETLKLQRAVRQMEAAQEVAQLEYEVAKSNLDALQTRLDAGTATIKDLGEARVQASEHYLALQDTTFELQRARVGLMRSTGELEKWISGSN
jgi:outer membrane protein TolC